jgi:hypothetical protein
VHLVALLDQGATDAQCVELRPRDVQGRELMDDEDDPQGIGPIERGGDSGESRGSIQYSIGARC